jgi:hypothetical protein
VLDAAEFHRLAQPRLRRRVLAAPVQDDSKVLQA